MSESALPEGATAELRHRAAELAAVAQTDAQAALALGDLLYEAGSRQQGIEWWEKAARLDRQSPAAWHRLGIGYYNVLHDKMAAKGAYHKAFKNSLTWECPSPDSPEAESVTEQAHREIRDAGMATHEIGDPAARGDARILYERDQLWKRTGETPAARAEELEKYPQLVRQRDDLTAEYCALLNQLGRHDEALTILQYRRFVPWEGGEALVLTQWARTQVALGRKKLWLSAGAGGDPRAALAHFQFALRVPEHLGDQWHPLPDNSAPNYWAGMAARACGDAALAQQHLAAAALQADRSGGQSYSEAFYWAGLAQRELGRHNEARKLFEAMLAYAERSRTIPAKADGIATPPPPPSIFEEDLTALQIQHATLIEALARHGLNGPGDRRAARRLLNDLLAENPNHGQAADLFIALDWDL